MVVRMCVVLVGGGGANAVQKFVSLKIAVISFLAVTILPAGPSQIYTPAWPARLLRIFRNFLCFYAPAVRLNTLATGFFAYFWLFQYYTQEISSQLAVMKLQLFYELTAKPVFLTEVVLIS